VCSVFRVETAIDFRSQRRATSLLCRHHLKPIQEEVKCLLARSLIFTPLSLV